MLLNKTLKSIATYTNALLILKGNYETKYIPLFSDHLKKYLKAILLFLIVNKFRCLFLKMSMVKIIKKKKKKIK